MFPKRTKWVVVINLHIYTTYFSYIERFRSLLLNNYQNMYININNDEVKSSQGVSPPSELLHC